MWKPLALLCALTFSAPALAGVTVGQQLQNPQLRDENNKPATIPNFGKKVLVLFYTDADVADQNDPFADVLKAADLDESLYQGVGIANMSDAPFKPNSVIRMIVRKKIEKYDSTILTDPDHLLADAWDLGDCNELSIVIILDKTGTVKYVKRGYMNDAEQQSGLELVKQLMAE